MGSSTFTLEQTEAAYLAGFIDGDGSIRPFFARDKRRYLLWIIKIKVSITQRSADAHVLSWVKKVVGGGFIHISQKRDQVEWTLNGERQIRELLPHLIPFLIVKKQRAIWAMKILTISNRHHEVASFIKAAKIAKLMRQANSRTPKLSYIDQVVKEVQERVVTP